MSNKVKPLLSCEVDIGKVNFPIYVSTKFDGIRCLIIDSVVYSRSLKPIRNKHVQELFGNPEYNGFDGELIVGDIYAPDVFQKTTSGVMSTEGTPDVTFYVFDLFTNNLSTYKERSSLQRTQANQTVQHHQSQTMRLLSCHQIANPCHSNQ